MPSFSGVKWSMNLGRRTESVIFNDATSVGWKVNLSKVRHWRSHWSCRGQSSTSLLRSSPVRYTTNNKIRIMSDFQNLTFQTIFTSSEVAPRWSACPSLTPVSWRSPPWWQPVIVFACLWMQHVSTQLNFSNYKHQIQTNNTSSFKDWRPGRRPTSLRKSCCLPAEQNGNLHVNQNDDTRIQSQILHEHLECDNIL